MHIGCSSYEATAARFTSVCCIVFFSLSLLLIHSLDVVKWIIRKKKIIRKVSARDQVIEYNNKCALTSNILYILFCGRLATTMTKWINWENEREKKAIKNFTMILREEKKSEWMFACRSKSSLTFSVYYLSITLRLAYK